MLGSTVSNLIATTALSRAKNKVLSKEVVMLRKFSLVFIYCFFLFTLVPVFAADQQPEQGNTTGVSQEDAKKLKEAAGVLGNAFGVKPKEDPLKQEQKQPDPPTQKNLADVADKGLDMVKNFVVTLSETLKNIGPKVWGVMVRQQYAKAVSYLVVPWGLFIVVLVYRSIMNKFWVKEENEKDTAVDSNGNDSMTIRCIFVKVAPFCFGFFFAIWGIVNLKDSILLLINPEYYAIKELLEMILK